jgi:hypothetical protein
MKAILIDVENKEVKEVEYEGDYTQVYKFINCELFSMVSIDKENIIYVDDEGLLNKPTKFFQIACYRDQLAGNGLILGVDHLGDSVSTSLSVEDIESMVTFIDYDNPEEAPQPEAHTFTVL